MSVNSGFTIQNSFETRDVTEDAKLVVKGVREMTAGRGRQFTLLHISEVFKGWLLCCTSLVNNKYT